MLLLFLLVSFVYSQGCQFPGTCGPPSSSYQRVMPVPSRLQWTYSGGFCGALSIQSIALSYGAWFSQGLIRKAAPQGGGHGNPTDGYEILHTNIEPALTNLKLTFSGWQHKTRPIPQSGDYLVWLKQSLVSGYPVVWFIMCNGDGHDTYGLAHYDHIEPVFGIFSNSSLSDPRVYPSDVLVHGSDWDRNPYYRRFDTLVDSAERGNLLKGNCSIAIPRGGGPNEAYPCLMTKIDYGWSIQGLVDPLKRIVPTSLEIQDSGFEPDKPTQTFVKVKMSKLQPGGHYSLFRFDGIANYPTDSLFEKYPHTKLVNFIPTSTTYTYSDPLQVDSSSAVYYVTIKAK